MYNVREIEREREKRRERAQERQSDRKRLRERKREKEIGIDGLSIISAKWRYKEKEKKKITDYNK